MIRVLIVEDEPVIAQAHREYLGRIGGFEVVDVVVTAQEAMRVARGGRVDLVLLDLGLPDARGLDLAGALSGVRPAPDMIAITAQRDLQSVRDAMSRGVLLYLLKPFTFAAFREKIEQYLRYRGALAADTDAVSQRDVDRALAELRTGDSRRSTAAGAAAETRDAVGRAVRDSADGLTASEVARAVGTSRVTAWRHLERLAEDRVVDRDTQYGSAGRPQVRYRWRRR
ncbi:response regulator [Gordonia paraffinivorans]|uniref:response regulator n=1 Tax=Gordonia paraffinivorans TaxID=175628 RepID=UPI0014477BE1|nr:response regulator [Gordonia paraffinivorans]